MGRPSGTTSYGYNPLEWFDVPVEHSQRRTITYTYDRASNLASTTDTRGTASCAFNTCKVSSSLRYRYNSGNDGANQHTKAAVTGGTAPVTEG